MTDTTIDAPTATITLKFNVHDAAKLRKMAKKAIEKFGDGIEVDSENPLSFFIVELLLHSNPAAAAYLDYGIELQDQVLQDEPAGSRS